MYFNLTSVASHSSTFYSLFTLIGTKCDFDGERVIVKITIKEKSFIARIAAKILHEERMAVTMGKTIHLWNVQKEDLLKNKKWLQHELVHVQQFEQTGFLKFLLLYLWESLKHGYQKNKFEVEARAKENENSSFTFFDFNE